MTCLRSHGREKAPSPRFPPRGPARSPRGPRGSDLRHVKPLSGASHRLTQPHSELQGDSPTAVALPRRDVPRGPAGPHRCDPWSTRSFGGAGAEQRLPCSGGGAVPAPHSHRLPAPLWCCLGGCGGQVGGDMAWDLRGWCPEGARGHLAHQPLILDPTETHGESALGYQPGLLH